MSRFKRGDLLEIEGQKYLLVPMSEWMLSRLRLEMDRLKKMGLDHVSGRELGSSIIEQYLHQVDEIDDEVGEEDAWSILWK